MAKTPVPASVRILVVEDNPMDVDLLRWALETASVPCELTVIEDGGEAIQFAQQKGPYASAKAPDLAILDLNLPRNDGIEVLEAMRANPAFAGVPVMILSSSSSPRERARLQVFGVGRYVAKPPDLDEYMKLGDVVRTFLLEAGSLSPQA
jgi:CheY-like chemotaxis protein